ncbi:alpha/beta hydrolase [Croceibacter atlanticus]|uniref:alpha/beta fold hydrolase n=1 Tax=Croceibacter atlanticus TaxID=313588 RepID=UPI002E10A7F8|nr:alpha/beta hydrolase [Croceibacter atlanticus]
MKNKTQLVILILIGVLFASCTALQYRETTEEVYLRHKTINIPTEITTFNSQVINRNIRVQAVKESNNNINVIFFHGSPSSMAAWRDYLIDTSLVKKANLYAVDRPGYGYSGFGDELTSIKTQAKVMNELINDYNLENVILVGTSYGGPLAARTAVLNTRVKALIMVSPALDPNQEKKIWASRLTQWWLTRWLVPTGYRVAGDEKTTHAKELEKIEDGWKALKIPVVHIHGTEDKVVPFGNINYSKEVFENITVIPISNAGHEIAWQKPELVKPEIEVLITTLIEDIKP